MAAATAGVRVKATISDEEIRQVLLALHPADGRPRGDGWARCLEQRAAIERWLREGIRLTKIRKLLVGRRAGRPLLRAGLADQNASPEGPGGQSIDASDYPIERSVYAMRNVEALQRQEDGTEREIEAVVPAGDESRDSPDAVVPARRQSHRP
jgi:hypothetical protein